MNYHALSTVTILNLDPNTADHSIQILHVQSCKEREEMVFLIAGCGPDEENCHRIFFAATKL